MKPIVIDASVAATWIIPEERSAATDHLYAEVVLGAIPFHAPGLWAWETTNLLLISMRRRSLSQDEFDSAQQLLDSCTLQLDPPPNPHRRAQLIRLASVHGLTAYDAAYLELALRLNGQLASLDKALVTAAKNCGISCLDFQTP